MTPPSSTAPLEPAGAGGPGLGATLGTGQLPPWTPYAVVAVSAALVAAILAAVGSFTFPLLVVIGVAISIAAIYTLSRVVESGRRATDRVITVIIASAFAIAVAPLISLLYQVISRGVARFDVAFFTESARGVVGEGGGAQHAVVGTLIITGIATLIAVPIGIMAAIYLTEYGNGSRLSRILTFLVDVMTGIPSIVAGLFAFALFGLFLGPGIRLGIIGSVALSVLMIPIVIRSSEEILKIVPNQLREASLALGTPKWKTIASVVLPTAMAGLVTGVMLSIARIVGETAPLLVTTGATDTTNSNPFSGRMQNLAVYAFNEYKNPGVSKQAAYDRAWTAALTLIAIVMLLSLLGRFIYRRYGTEIR